MAEDTPNLNWDKMEQELKSGELLQSLNTNNPGNRENVARARAVGSQQPNLLVHFARKIKKILADERSTDVEVMLSLQFEGEQSKIMRCTKALWKFLKQCGVVPEEEKFSQHVARIFMQGLLLDMAACQELCAQEEAMRINLKTMLANKELYYQILEGKNQYWNELLDGEDEE